METAGTSGAVQLWKLGRKLGLAFVLVLGLVGSVTARAPLSDNAVVALAALPVEARQTDLLIRGSGPFPYAKDGSVFGNREKLLPRQARGFYREYTVKTPGSRDRGARRIVCGGLQPAAPEACYYTGDHYASFRRIVQ